MEQWVTIGSNLRKSALQVPKNMITNSTASDYTNEHEENQSPFRNIKSIKEMSTRISQLDRQIKQIGNLQDVISQNRFLDQDRLSPQPNQKVYA